MSTSPREEPDTETAVLVMHENMIAAASFAERRGAYTALLALNTGFVFGNHFSSERQA